MVFNKRSLMKILTSHKTSKFLLQIHYVYPLNPFVMIAKRVSHPISSELFFSWMISMHDVSLTHA